MYIPEEMLPKITVSHNGKPQLPSTKGERWLGGGTTPETKAQHYFAEALQKLALAKYWAEYPTTPAEYDEDEEPLF